jgi:hypothetical protein
MSGPVLGFDQRFRNDRHSGYSPVVAIGIDNIVLGGR